MGEEYSDVFGSKGGEPPVADEVHEPRVESLDTSGKRTLLDETSARDSAMPVTSGISLLCWRNKATAAVSEPGRVPKDRERPWRRETMSAFEYV